MTGGARPGAEPLPPPAADERILTLDVIRGVAVMGILAMNIVAFAMPFQAYANPYALGDISQADLATWGVNFILVDGKMRGLFCLLFGAGISLAAERALAAGRPPFRAHLARMAWLLVFGLVHYYFIWFGDILAGYAQVGLIAFLFWRVSSRRPLLLVVALIVAQTLWDSVQAIGAQELFVAIHAPGASADLVAQADRLRAMFGPLNARQISAENALFLGDYAKLVEHRLTHNLWSPFSNLLSHGLETLAYFLLGIVLLRNGFLTGQWPAARYRTVAIVGFAVAIPAFGILGWLMVRHGFELPVLIACTYAAPVPFRPVMVVAIAAVIILAARKDGPIRTRIGAVGRAAFTNYLLTSIVMVALFYGIGLGLFGTLSRSQTWLPVLGMWALMLAWSKPWLDRFRYGPFEWLWRSLARGRPQPLRRPG